MFNGMVVGGQFPPKIVLLGIEQTTQISAQKMIFSKSHPSWGWDGDSIFIKNDFFARNSLKYPVCTENHVH